MGFAPKRTVASMAYGWLIFETFASSGRNQNGFSKALFARLLASYGTHWQRLDVGRAYYRANSLLLVCIGATLK